MAAESPRMIIRELRKSVFTARFMQRVCLRSLYGLIDLPITKIERFAPCTVVLNQLSPNTMASMECSYRDTQWFFPYRHRKNGLLA